MRLIPDAQHANMPAHRRFVVSAAIPQYPKRTPADRFSDIRWVPIDALEPCETAFPDRVQSVAAGMERRDPMPALIVVPAGTQWRVIDGHHRLEGARRRGCTQVPIRELLNPSAAVRESALREFNPYHDPANGRFTTGRRVGGSAVGGPERIVGITSTRPSGDVAYRSQKEVAATMHQFEGRLKALPGVRSVQVVPALGQWDGSSEFSWAVGYDGNGQARKLLADYGKTWHQDAVLLVRPVKAGETEDTAWELEFSAVDMSLRAASAKEMGQYLGGWTWFKRGGRTVLRSIAVPAWGGNNTKQRRARQGVRRMFERQGIRTVRVRVIHGKKTEVLGSVIPYDDVLKGRA